MIIREAGGVVIDTKGTINCRSEEVMWTSFLLLCVPQKIDRVARIIVIILCTGGDYDIMKPRTIAAANETLARELSKLIIDTDLKTQRKRLQRT